MAQRDDIVKIMQSWVGLKEADGSFKRIIDTYNGEKPLARGYAVKYTDAWCATTVSAAAIAAGIPRDIFPRECGCEAQTKLFASIGSWVEDDSYVPRPGDVIYYDWQDDGKGDDTGYSDHVGIVESCVDGKIVVIEGNHANAVGRRTLEVNGKFIRGYGVPRYVEEATAAEQQEAVIEQYYADKEVDPPSVEEQIWNYLVSVGFNAYAVAGIMGNLYAESALNPKNLQNSYEIALKMTDESYTAAVDDGSYPSFVRDSAGYGLAQWTYWSRKAGLLEAAKAAGTSVGDLSTQLVYLVKELKSYAGVYKALMAAKSVQEASDVVLLDFEKPANQSEAVKTTRASYGMRYFKKYAQMGDSGGGVAASEVVGVGVSAVGYAVPSVVLKRGSRGDGVKWVQASLNARGYSIAVDGSFGPMTEFTVRHYQKVKSLQVDGVVGPQTRQSLLS